MSASRRRLRDRFAFWALAGVALLAVHDAVHLAQIGPARAVVDALRTGAHGYWGAASLVISVIAAVAATSTLIRTRRLRRRAAALRAVPASGRPFGRRFVGAWWRLAAVVAIAFALQENAEHLVTHGHVIGTRALAGPEYPLALPVIGFVAAIAAAIAAMVSGTQEALVAAIEAALRRLRPARRLIRRPAPMPAAIGSVLARPGAGRAPPKLFVPAA